MTQENINRSNEAANELQHLFGARPPKKVFVKRKDDPRFWKPNVNNAAKEYQAMVRILPRDIGGTQNFFVRQDMHYFKDISGTKVVFAAKCRGTLGLDDCPICQYANQFRNHNNNPEMKKLWEERRASKKFMANILVIKDLTNPANDGQILIWEHTPPVARKLNAPAIGGVQLDSVKTFGAEPVLVTFDPSNLKTGHNFVVHMNLDQKGFPTYDPSYWDHDPMSIANDAATENQIMSSIHNLNEFMDDVESVDVLQSRLQEFLAKQSLTNTAAPAQPAFAAPSFGSVPPVAGFGTKPSFAVNTAPVASAPAAVAGFNTAGFAQPKQGNSAAYFAPQHTAPNDDQNVVDDLPF